jgi:hypothetical protein
MVVAMLVALAAGACGSGEEEKSPPRTQPAPVKYETIAITEPDEPLRADTASGGKYTVNATVRGTSEPLAELFVTADCLVAGCEVLTRADGQGKWKAEVVLEAERKKPTLGLTARYADEHVEGEPGETTVKLRRPVRGPRADRAKTQPQPAPSGPAGDDELGGSGDDAADSGRTPKSLVMVGDSLAEGTETVLPGLLKGWNVQTDARRGRPLAEGMRVLDGIQFEGPTVLALSLFTNDDPNNVAALEAAVKTSVRRVSATGGCVLWATIARPPLNGVPYTKANAKLRELETELDGKMTVVPWAETVAERPELLAGDKVHGTPAGYGVRAALYADAAKSCRV